jgi:hypothetical protein
MRGVPADGTLRKLSLSQRRDLTVFDDSGRWNGARWKVQTLEFLTGGTGTKRRGGGLNWRSQAPKPSDVSLKEAFGD